MGYVRHGAINVSALHPKIGQWHARARELFQVDDVFVFGDIVSPVVHGRKGFASFTVTFCASIPEAQTTFLEELKRGALEECNFDWCSVEYGGDTEGVNTLDAERVRELSEYEGGFR